MPKIEIESIVSPGHVQRVDAAKYGAVRAAYLSALPDAAPGLAPSEILSRMIPLLPDDLFPGGAKAGWWAKAAQLDLEAKGVIVRAARPPVRLWRA